MLGQLPCVCRFITEAEQENGPRHTTRYINLKQKENKFRIKVKAFFFKIKRNLI